MITIIKPILPSFAQFNIAISNSEDPINGLHMSEDANAPVRGHHRGCPEDAIILPPSEDA